MAQKKVAKLMTLWNQTPEEQEEKRLSLELKASELSAKADLHQAEKKLYDQEKVVNTLKLKLENALGSERGQLVQKALDLRALLKAGVTITLDEIAADEMYALLIIEQEQNRYESEQSDDK